MQCGMLLSGYSRLAMDMGLDLITGLQEENKVEVNRVPIPSCGANDILMKTVCASLCHSDLVRATKLQDEDDSRLTLRI